ncbi:uncharacterized protein LOC131598591 [Vicia villosa]|uniref:uncharacterized protein LOC131598591 n=1 Tax=Vicia villosa TaxID=3911 RepID=UPI00273ADC11|nr:uncharacterized protein LOC131598591 [Vicia villosa]
MDMLSRAIQHDHSYGFKIFMITLVLKSSIEEKPEYVLPNFARVNFVPLDIEALYAMLENPMEEDHTPVSNVLSGEAIQAVEGSNDTKLKEVKVEPDVGDIDVVDSSKLNCAGGFLQNHIWWEKKISKSQKKGNQVMQFLAEVIQKALRPDQTSCILFDLETYDDYQCTIMKSKRPYVEMYIGQEWKKGAALARRKRKQIMKDKRSKRNRSNENTNNCNISFTNISNPANIHVRTPLSNITSAVLNDRNHNCNANPIGTVMSNAHRINVGVSHVVSSNLFRQFGVENRYYASSPISTLKTPTSALGSSKSSITLDHCSPQHLAASARQRRKTIMQQKANVSNILRSNIVNNSDGDVLNTSPLTLNSNTAPSGITSSLSNQRYKSIHPQTSGIVYSSKIQLNVGCIQSVTTNLFNTFSNIDYGGASSSTSHLPSTTHANISMADANISSTNANIECDESDEECLTDEYFSDSSCEFIKDNAEDDISSCSDDDQYYDPNSIQVNEPNSGYSDIGDPAIECAHCGALMWYQEKLDKRKHSAAPKFSLCCGNGKIVLPLLKPPPPLLKHLLFDNNDVDCQNYQQHCRLYNIMFAFTSPGMKFDNRFQTGRGPPNIRIQGQSCHRIGSMIPLPGQSPKFAQLYIYDTDNEIQHRIKGIGNNPNIVIGTVNKLKAMMDEFNTHAKSFRMAADRLKDSPVADLKLKLIADRKKDGRTYNQPTVSEVAALIVGDVDIGSKRDIILERQSGRLKRISEFHPSYLALQYPLLFPYGEDGFRLDVLHRETNARKKGKQNKLTIREWLAFRIQTRQHEAHTLLRSRRLFQQFLVDGFTMMESQRLNYIRKHQKKLRVSKYSNLSRPEETENTQGADKGKRVVLPSTYVGSRRYMEQLYFDGMAICSHIGFPDLFITFTCNPNWPEIGRLLKKINLQPHDRPDIISRVFKIKLDELLSDLTKKHVLGRVVAYIYTIEFQKRGLPHAHILLFMHPSSKYPTPDDINNIISAEIPSEDNDRQLYHLVKTHMIHGPCGLNQTVVDHDGYPMYRRRETGITVMKKNVVLDNRYVVPYNPFLLKKFQAHINMEWCNQGTSVKYLFKYINKGCDRITATIVDNDTDGNSIIRNVDEIKQYLDCRYVSPSEACWRIFSFPIHGRSPAVERLYFHLEGENPVYYTDHELIDEVLDKPSVKESMFTAWMEANKTYSEARNLTYSNFLTKFVYDKRYRRWRPRKRGHTIGRLIWVPPSTGELYYLRMMLTVVKGPTCYEDIKKVGGIIRDSFRDACFEMGFLNDDKEYVAAINEAKDWGSGHFLRKLFVTMLLSGTINRPRHVWEKTWRTLSDGILYQQRQATNRRDMQLSITELKNLTLIEIENMLQSNRRSLHEFKDMPYPDSYVTRHVGNRLIWDERSYNIHTEQQNFQNLFRALTDEQRSIFDTIMKAVEKQRGGVFFLHGYGGTGKTFMWRTLSSALRSQQKIVLTVASSGIASLLLPGGRTAHSKFKIPVPTLDNSTCNVDKNDEYSQLFEATDVIIWDEAPMSHKNCFEALDKTLKDVMTKYGLAKTIFGGKVVVFGGDFRQILPVVPRAGRSDIVHASICLSYVWDYCQVLTLTKNMRLQQGRDDTSSTELAEFSKWILNVGDGKLCEPNDGLVDIEIPQDLLISNFDDPIKAIVESTYPDLVHNFQDVGYLQGKAILASTIEVVDKINQYVLDMIPGEEKEYLSFDTIDRTNTSYTEAYEVLTPEFLSKLRTSGLPNHRIKLKVGTPIMLMRNLDQTDGLCNGTRLIVTRLANHVIEAKIMSGKNIGNIFYIPRMSMSPSESPWPFKLIRRQFPIIVSYAMTINKSQGQSLDNVGLYLPTPVFSHGQLYVAISRVTTKNGLKILIHDKDNAPCSTTTNVVYKEVFQALC